MIKSKDNFFQVSDGAWIYFEDYGKDKGDPIVILHGFLCSSKFFYYKYIITKKRLLFSNLLIILHFVLA